MKKIRGKQPPQAQKPKKSRHRKLSTAARVNKTAAAYPCDFDMAPLQTIDPWHLMDPGARDDDLELQNFALALALAYNDLKGQYAWFVLLQLKHDFSRQI